MNTYNITHIGHRGDGVASGPVYAAMTAPGEVVAGDLLGDRLTNIRILEPSADRIAPPCRHFKSCGGCAMQHLRDDVVATWKTDNIGAALAAHGLETRIRPIITSPPQSRRRATFSAMRTKKGALVGFHARAQETIIPIPDCMLIAPDLRHAIAACEAIARVGASRTTRLSITVTQVRHGLDVLVKGGKSLDLPLRTSLAEIAERERLTRLVWEDEVVALRVPSLVAFDGIDVTIPPGAFLQATEDGEAALRTAVHEIVGPAKSVVDLFSGCGTFALPLAREREVEAFEGDGAMVEVLSHGWRHAQGLKSVRAIKRDLFRNPVQAAELSYAAAVIDPPRAGAEAQIDELARSKIPTIAHVSCNPQTFARDARRLIDGGYVLDWVQPVDQFRWSPHIELVGAFFRK